MTVLEIIIASFGVTNLVLTWFVIFPLHQPTTVLNWIVKVTICGLSPVLFLLGIATLATGSVLNSVPVMVAGGLSAALYLMYILAATRSLPDSEGCENVFGKQWNDKINAVRKSYMLKRRYVFVLPKCGDPIVSRNVAFYTIPGTNRQLLCDVWQPPEDIAPSGIAFIYLHGSAWTHLDKDCGTRTFFRHLANQGHVIMDVAYRLFPETDFKGMVYDTKHAIAWLKSSASTYRINPDKVVVGGGSAGAHLALLAAYTYKNTELTPPDLQNCDLSVRGVISLYGQSELSATYYHTAQHLVKHSALAAKKGNKSGVMPGWIRKRMGADFHRLQFDKNVEPGMLCPLLGGCPDEIPEAYALFSPISHVHENCPMTLMIHGEHDILAPLEAIRSLYKKLDAAGVPVILQTIAKTDHAFDLVLPKISPSAHNAIYHAERFLAMIESNDLRATNNRHFELDTSYAI